MSTIRMFWITKIIGQNQCKFEKELKMKNIYFITACIKETILQVTDTTSGSTQQYCGDVIPRPQLFSGNEAAIKFVTNGNRDDLKASFKIHFTGKIQ